MRDNHRVKTALARLFSSLSSRSKNICSHFAAHIHSKFIAVQSPLKPISIPELPQDYKAAIHPSTSQSSATAGRNCACRNSPSKESPQVSTGEPLSSTNTSDPRNIMPPYSKTTTSSARGCSTWSHLGFAEPARSRLPDPTTLPKPSGRARLSMTTTSSTSSSAPPGVVRVTIRVHTETKTKTKTTVSHGGGRKHVEEVHQRFDKILAGPPDGGGGACSARAGPSRPRPILAIDDGRTRRDTPSSSTVRDPRVESSSRVRTCAVCHDSFSTTYVGPDHTVKCATCLAETVVHSAAASAAASGRHKSDTGAKRTSGGARRPSPPRDSRTHPSAASGAHLPTSGQIQLKDGSTRNIQFPAELNNTDYLFRIVRHVTHSLRDVYGELITRRGVAPYVMNGVTKDASTACAHTILKHMINNSRVYARSLSVPESDLLTAARALLQVRCDIAHDNTNGKTSKTDVEDAFANAKLLVWHNPSLAFAKANLVRLEEQFKHHHRTKLQRSAPHR